jgi:hypothetical protein
MTDLTAELTNRNAEADQPPKYSDQTAVHNGSLDGRYRQIGISAVAAALRYQGGAKNPAYAPASSRWQDHTGNAGA